MINTKDKLIFRVSNFGFYYSCILNGIELTKMEFMKITSIDPWGKGVEKKFNEWADNQSEYDCEVYEKDVS